MVAPCANVALAKRIAREMECLIFIMLIEFALGGLISDGLRMSPDVFCLTATQPLRDPAAPARRSFSTRRPIWGQDIRVRHSSFSSVTDQVTKLLREGLVQGRWRGTLPGRDRLADELGVNHKTVEAAMRRLAGEGLLVSQGPGQRRRIVLPEAPAETRGLRVRILLYERKDIGSREELEVLAELDRAGFAAGFAQKSLHDLGMDPERVAHFVEKTQADAWIVCEGSREVLEWFSHQAVPVFALFGVKSGLPIAGSGPWKDPSIVVRRLVELGHRRIVMLTREERLIPKPALYEQSFLDALEAHGIATGTYHLPRWGDTPGQLHRYLDPLFRHSPPTALMISEATLFIAVRDHLAQRGIIAPRDVSLICDDRDVALSWCDPEVACFEWEFAPIRRRILHWAKRVAQGKDDRRQTFSMARFIEGGTIGPAP
jgi:DNA-binding LacI/PurR family transcriptional regulator/DNA-binding transcriptional regulator YhcF (GntR family)